VFAIAQAFEKLIEDTNGSKGGSAK
jgi:hypothetical protein